MFPDTNLLRFKNWWIIPCSFHFWFLRRCTCINWWGRCWLISRHRLLWLLRLICAYIRLWLWCWCIISRIIHPCNRLLRITRLRRCRWGWRGCIVLLHPCLLVTSTRIFSWSWEFSMHVPCARCRCWWNSSITSCICFCTIGTCRLGCWACGALGICIRCVLGGLGCSTHLGVIVLITWNCGCIEGILL